MASSLIKRASLDAMKRALEASISPALGLTIEVASADWEEPTKLPSVRLIPGKYTFEPWQEREADDTQPDRVFLEVGTFEGTVELRCYACNKTEREEIEDAVLNAFLSTELAPGILTAQTVPLTVGGFATIYQAVASFALDTEEWREEMVFNKKRASFMDVTAWYPALATRGETYTIEQLILAFNEDLSSDAVGEKVLVADDGTTTPTNL